MNTIKILKEYSDNVMTNFPSIVYSNLYKRVQASMHLEFEINGETYLYSPLYTQIRGPEGNEELSEWVAASEPFLNSFKEYLVSSLYVYSALVEESSYYVTNPQSIVIARITHNRDHRFEIKYYVHYKDELLKSYADKIYIGRDFINLRKFERKYLGLKKYFLSLIEQDQKVQERAKQKLRYYDDYKETYLDEIEYLTKEAFREAMDRVRLFRDQKLSDISKVKSLEVLDEIHYLHNLMIELRDITQEFDSRLRLRGEVAFVKYLIKYSKDITDTIRYLRKLSTLLHLKISNYKIY